MFYLLRKKRITLLVILSLLVLFIYSLSRIPLQVHVAGSNEVSADASRPSLYKTTANLEKSSNQTTLTTLPQTTRRRRRISVELVGNARLGNLMFGHASMLGIADRNGFDPVVSQTNKHLFEAFDLVTETQKLDKTGWLMCEEKFASVYDDNLNTKVSHSPDNVLLFGYFQSWRYFANISERVLRDFRFKTDVAKQATEFINAVTQKHFPTSIKNKTLHDSILRIGIHVRRNDMTIYSSLQKGYTIATIEYLENAMAFLEQHLSNATGISPLPLVYIVVSDDMGWCKTKLVPRKYPIEFSSEHNKPAVDMAIMASCNHTIITVGSFGWWGAYMAGGMTVYYKDFPAPGSEIARAFLAQDYFHPKWIGLS